MFKKDDLALYDKPIAAQYVDNDTTTVFDNRATAKTDGTNVPANPSAMK